MKNTVIINKEYVLGDIEKDVWGSFIEHMGRAVYDGIYEPSHPLADEQGFRKDVMDAVRALHVPKVRYPGGNFLSGYDWRDGIGKNRPARLDLAWGQLETNEVGLHEFCGWAEKVGAEVMMSVNMGTGTPKDAAQLVEYCNHEKGTAISDLRRKNGREKPFGIKTWCIGNEMDGDWQICALTAEEYGRKAAETAKMMRWVDKDIELVVCGSSTPDQKTYPEWDRIVLQHTYDYVDYLSMHRYYTYPDDTQNITDFLSSHTDFDAFIKTVAAAADYVKAYKRSRKVMKISVDEWNIWHTKPAPNGLDVHNDCCEARWTRGARRLENIYDLADALALAGMACTLINNADRVKMGCLAQLVNVIAPIFTEPGGGLFRQTIYYPYKMVIEFAKGAALRTVVRGEKMASRYGDTEKVYTACAYENGTYALFAINKTSEQQTCDLDFQVTPVRMVERIELSGRLHDYNTMQIPEKIVPKNVACDCGAGKIHTVELPAYSFTLLRFSEEK